MKMFMRCIILIAGLFFTSTCFAQNKLTGKWKPVYFVLDKIMIADVKADSVHMSDSLDVVFKNDKDPEMSKKMMQFLGQMLLKKMQDTQQEFLPSGVYIETLNNTATNGTYTYDSTGNLTIIQPKNKTSKYTVSFKNDHLVLTSALENPGGRKGVLVVEYEKL